MGKKTSGTKSDGSKGIIAAKLNSILAKWKCVVLKMTK